MQLVPMFLFVFAIVFFVIAGLTAVPEPWHNRLVCLGLACLTGAEMAKSVWAR